MSTAGIEPAPPTIGWAPPQSYADEVGVFQPLAHHRRKLTNDGGQPLSQSASEVITGDIDLGSYEDASYRDPPGPLGAHFSICLVVHRRRGPEYTYVLY